MRHFMMHVQRHQRKLLFALVGISVMLTGYGILFVMVDGLHQDTKIAYIVQAVVSVELNFVLNYRLTWKDREGSIWGALVRFHTSRVFTIAGNQLLFNALIAIGTQYLLANTVCIIGTTVVNYAVGDKFVFRGRAKSTNTEVVHMSDQPTQELPKVSVIIPVKNNGDSIRATVKALLLQSYLLTPEIIIVGDRNDTSWGALKGLDHVLTLIEADITSPGRDTNVKRNIGLMAASPDSAILAVVDGDVVVDVDWLEKVVQRLHGDIAAVAGPVSGIGQSFWAGYIDRNPTAAKTPRIEGSFVLDHDTLGRRKPPVTANFALTRELYEHVGGPNTAFTNSYEDYEWFSRIVQAGFRILCDEALNSTRYHREGLRPLMREYRRSGRGCADHIVVHFTRCPFARKRVRQLLAFYGLAAMGLAALVLLPWVVVSAGVMGVALLVLHSGWKVRRVSALSYPLISIMLGTLFVYGATSQLLKRGQLQYPILHETRWLRTAAETS